jgi:hypothetical protein
MSDSKPQTQSGSAGRTWNDPEIARELVEDAHHAFLCLHMYKRDDSRARAISGIDSLLTRTPDCEESAIVHGGAEACQKAWAAIGELGVALRGPWVDAEPFWIRAIDAVLDWKFMFSGETRALWEVHNAATYTFGVLRRMRLAGSKEKAILMFDELTASTPNCRMCAIVQNGEEACRAAWAAVEQLAVRLKTPAAEINLREAILAASDWMSALASAVHNAELRTPLWYATSADFGETDDPPTPPRIAACDCSD